MPALHVYLPTSADRDAAWAFAAVRSTLARDGVAFGSTVNPFTRQEGLKVVVDGRFRLSIWFDTGDGVDDDLRTVTGQDRTGFSRLRVTSGPDPENEHSDVVVELLALADTLGPVLVHGVTAGTVFTDTLPPVEG